MDVRENIWVAGPGGALPSTRGRKVGSGFLARHGNGWVQFDAGFGTYNASGRLAAVDLADVRILVLTHLHADHVGDAITTIHGIQLLSQKKYGEVQLLEILGPAGIREAVLEGLVWLGAPEFKFNLVFHEGPGKYGPMRLFSVMHSSIESVAAVLHGDIEVMYTGDISDRSGNFRAILEATENPGVLITEATEPNNPCHITAVSAEALSQAGNYEMTVIGHCRDNHEAAVGKICRRSGGRIVAAQAGLGITI